MRSEFGKVRECLDVSHALELLSGIGKLFDGEESVAQKRWYEPAQKDLLSGGGTLIEKRLAGLEEEVRTDGQRESLRRVRDYFSNHSERLWEGRAIGSGQVEGACKSMVGKRLKQTGARWKVRNLNRILSLCASRYSDAWEDYWRKAT